MPSTRRSSTISAIFWPITSAEVWYGQLGDDDAHRAGASLLDLGDRAHAHRAPAGLVDLGEPRATEDQRAGREVGCQHELLEVGDRRIGVVEEMHRRVDDLAQVVRRDVGGHPDRDPAAAVDEQVGIPRRQHDRLGGAAVVGGLHVDGVFVDRSEELHRERREPRLGVARRGRPVVGVG